MNIMMKTVISTLFLILISIWGMGCQTVVNEGDKSSITQYYDANGLRVARKEQITRAGATEALPESVTFYMYDQQGRLIAEANQDAGVIREYLYLEGQPLAKIFSPNYTSTNSDGTEVNQQFFVYLHNDHLGTPRLLTGEALPRDDASLEEIISSPFGQRVTPDFFNNFEFPGQYYDYKTGYSYNFHRDYDPSTGSYIQSDPIGLAGGINTYAYAMGNPIKYSDPQGLCIGPFAFACTWFLANAPTINSAVIIGAEIAAGVSLASHASKLATPAASSLKNALHHSCPVVTKGGPKLLTHSRGVGGNGAASELGNLGSRNAGEVREMLQSAGFEGKSIAKSGYQRFKHGDGSEIWANWQTGRIVRNAAPKYGSNGARINKGQRLGPDGAEIPRNIPHDRHPVESFIP